jgi:outer membrane protein assembly factor BamB
MTIARVSRIFVVALGLSCITCDQPEVETTRAGLANPVTVSTNRYDNLRTGANTGETILTPANVSGGKFGLLFSRSVDGQIYANPLIQPSTCSGKACDVAYVATEHNSVYAFDVTDANATAPLWHVSLGASVPLTPGKNIRCADMFPEQGITPTPVLDVNTGTLYVENVDQVSTGHWAHKLHALDAHTGAEKFGGPVTITASGFNPSIQQSRAGLLLENGTVYLAFASNCDQFAYHGWVFAYDAATLAQRGSFNATPGGSEGGIWMSGIGLSSDGSGIFFAAGNGSFDASNNGKQVGISLARLTLGSSGLHLADWWTPANAADLNSKDNDLTGTMLIPGSKLMLGGSKDGFLYFVDRTNMGHFQPAHDPAGHVTVGGHVHGGPIYWDSPSGPRAYVWSENSPLVAFNVTHTGLTTTGLQSQVVASGHPGGITTLSANGSTNGIIWGSYAPKGDAWHHLVPGTLVAFDAGTLKVLWRSDTNASDAVGLFAKFNPPIVANGHVYLGSQSKELRIYGLH